MTEPNYFSAFDAKQIVKDYPHDSSFIQRYGKISRDELRSIQESRFLQCVHRAWRIPFYQRHWRAHGLEEGDIRRLDDLASIPPYSKADLMKSVRAHPPFGDFHGMETFTDGSGSRPPVILQTTSGTTGQPQPLFFGPKSREIQNLLYVRALLLQGMTHDDIVHMLYGFGTVNAGHYVREAITHFTGALLITASTGNVTPSRQQVQLMHTFGSTVLIGFSDYVRKLADVAREEGFEPGKDVPVRLICSSIGGDSRELISKTWGGADVFDIYGVGDTGVVAAEGPEMSGLHIWEDGHVVEIVDPDTLSPIADGEIGNIVVTSLFKDDIFPNIRFNTNDLSRILTDSSPTGWTFRRMGGFLGRSDGMVKLRGINVYPTAVGELIRAESHSNGEFLCEVDRIEGRDELTVRIEVTSQKEDEESLALHFQKLLREKIGVSMNIELVAPGVLAATTGLEDRQKAVRLVDKRKVLPAN